MQPIPSMHDKTTIANACRTKHHILNVGSSVPVRTSIIGAMPLSQGPWLHPFLICLLVLQIPWPRPPRTTSAQHVRLFVTKSGKSEKHQVLCTEESSAPATCYKTEVDAFINNFTEFTEH